MIPFHGTRPNCRQAQPGPGAERAPARPGDGTRPSTRASRRAAAFAVWYLRVVTFLNFLSAVWVSLGQDVRRHNTEDYFTPYLLTAGFASGVFTMFLAITMRRRKRAAWILNLVLSGALPAAVRLRDGLPRDPSVPAELDLPRPDRRLRGVPRRRPARVLREGRPLEPEARRGRGGRRTAALLAARRAPGDRHEPRRRRGALDLPGPLALRHPAADLGRRRRLPFPRDHDSQLGERHHQRAQHPARPRRLLRGLPLPPRRRPAHRGRRGAAAGAARPERRPRLPRLLRAAPREERGVVADRQGGRRLPRRERCLAGLRRPHRRSRGLARRHRAPGSPRRARTAGSRR